MAKGASWKAAGATTSRPARALFIRQGALTGSRCPRRRSGAPPFDLLMKDSEGPPGSFAPGGQKENRHGRLRALPGNFVWFEHVAKDAKKAQAFYGGVFGWRVAPFPMPEPSPTR